MPPRRLLTIGHSYVVSLNRRLAHELARAGRARWEVTVAAPSFFHGDLRPLTLETAGTEPCRVEPVNAYGSRHIHVMAYGRRTKRLLADGWDLVHTWEEPYIFAGIQLARWTPRNVPLVSWTAQNIAKRYPPPFNWFEQSVVRRCAGWIAVGQTTAEVHLNRGRGYEARPHRVLPLGVDCELFRPDPAARSAIRQTLGWEADGPPVVGYLGRFVPQKGLKLLTAALDAQRSPWRALFVGSGPAEAELRTWAGRHAERVRIVTGVTHERVPAYLNAMDLLAAPSQTTPRWREQFGRMLVEAMACRVAVLGSDSGEIPHVLGDAGRIVPEADLAAWTTAIADVLENAGRRADWALRGEARVRERFAWPVVARQHLEFFDEVLATRAASAGAGA